jgi:hypothetical protein
MMGLFMRTRVQVGAWRHDQGMDVDGNTRRSKGTRGGGRLAEFSTIP